MAYSANGLALVANGGSTATGTGSGSAKSLYMYVTADVDTVVEADGYFDTTDLVLGDLVLASLAVGGTEEIKAYTVSVGSGDKDSNDVTIVAMLIA